MADTLAIHGGTPVRTAPFPSWPIFGDEEERRLLAALKSGKWGKIDGSEVKQFEKRFAEYHGAKHGVAVVNGTTGLRLALLATGIEAGDEVIVPPFTFLATASTVIEVNATPVFADLQLDTFNIDPAAIEAAITPRTRVIVPVHLGGLPCDMDAILDVARRHSLMVLEDCAHAHGAAYKGRRVGSFGNMAMFSFQGSKNLNSGEGGIVLTSDDELAARLWSLHNCGRRPGRAWYEHFVLGGNNRLSEFQGAILHAQWERFEEQAQRREENGLYLDERLSSIPGIHPQARTADCTRHAYHLFPFRIDPAELGASREAFLEALNGEGIPAAAAYPVPLYRQPVFEQLLFGPYTGYRNARPDLDYKQTSCPNCETISFTQGVWLEHRLLLGTRQDMDDVADAIRKVYDNRDRLAAS
ncbi:MAG TPA: DegT/DnrJ/EryC1/StrS family aminotransferase [Thermoguttaceae bacterium]|nr:DegT/DnrJ/EryC1/StrS family aminotransferase [Thermoguttaceae bacterium]